MRFCNRRRRDAERHAVGDQQCTARLRHSSLAALLLATLHHLCSRTLCHLCSRLAALLRATLCRLCSRLAALLLATLRRLGSLPWLLLLDGQTQPALHITPGHTHL